MSSSQNHVSKKDERRARNLQSANISRQRRREHISSLTEEKARLLEANALLRSRLSIAPSGSVPPRASVEGSSSRHDSGELGPTMQGLLRKKEIDGAAAIDLLDRAVHGGKGRGTPLDPDAAKKFGAAARKAPKDVQRPLKHVTPGESTRRPGGSGGKSAGKSSSRSRAPYTGTRKK